MPTTTINERLKITIDEKLTAIDTDERYNEYIDEIYQEQIDAIPFLMGARASKLFEENDPIAYRCGKNDWEDGASRDGEWVTIDNGDKYYERKEVEDVRDELADEMERDLEAWKEEDESERAKVHTFDVVWEYDTPEELEAAIEAIRGEDFDS